MTQQVDVVVQVCRVVRYVFGEQTLSSCPTFPVCCGSVAVARFVELNGLETFIWYMEGLGQTTETPPTLVDELLKCYLGFLQMSTGWLPPSQTQE